jgi:hypothetical protein
MLSRGYSSNTTLWDNEGRTGMLSATACDTQAHDGVDGHGDPTALHSHYHLYEGRNSSHLHT